ncbi:hypothetical protein [uncultured Brevundimonas sp.]|uniref:hypothetical protein n=1 Tax=uncultured Brevundimonas sp. TaxID=213418 RepID=UPI0030EBCC13
MAKQAKQLKSGPGATAEAMVADTIMPPERRGKERRKPGNRINRHAPRRSLMKLIGAYALVVSGGVFALILLADQMLDLGSTLVGLSFVGALIGVSILVLALGALEERLIEIRLELMMLNGGMRQGERRAGERRSGDRSGGPENRRG